MTVKDLIAKLNELSPDGTASVVVAEDDSVTSLNEVNDPDVSLVEMNDEDTAEDEIMTQSVIRITFGNEYEFETE